jgi:hypothetical protein
LGASITQAKVQPLDTRVVHKLPLEKPAPRLTRPEPRMATTKATKATTQHWIDWGTGR